ncbi:MAG: MgtC/SapB family protein, partial [bacterium]
MQLISNLSLGGFVVALGVGLLIGVDRERQKGSGPGRGAAGIRTFALVALLGATAASLQSAVLIMLFGAGTAALAVAAYVRTPAADPGITTEIALLVTYALGVLAIAKPEVAAGLGVLVALLLASRSSIHEFVHQRLTDREEFDAILLAAAALIVLPMLPDHAIDPYGVVNPQVIWRLTVAVLLVNAFGYVALRTLGANTGLAAAGFFGGFVSSAATIGTLGRRAKLEVELARSAVAGAALSSVATVVQLALVLAISNPALLARLSLALALMGVVAAGYGLLFFYMAARSPQSMQTATGRAFQPGYALLFALAVTALLLICAFLADRFG